MAFSLRDGVRYSKNDIITPKTLTEGMGTGQVASNGSGALHHYSVDSNRMDSPPCTVCGERGVGQTPGQFLCFYQAVLGDRKEMICPDCQSRLIFMAVDMLREKLQQEHDCPACHGRGYIEGPDLPMVCNSCIGHGVRR